MKAIENWKSFKAQPSDRSPVAQFVHSDGSAATSIAVSGKEFVERIMSRNCRSVQIRFDNKVISVGAFVGNSLMLERISRHDAFDKLFARDSSCLWCPIQLCRWLSKNGWTKYAIILVSNAHTIEIKMYDSNGLLPHLVETPYKWVGFSLNRVLFGKKLFEPFERSRCFLHLLHLGQLLWHRIHGLLDLGYSFLSRSKVLVLLGRLHHQ